MSKKKKNQDRITPVQLTSAWVDISVLVNMAETAIAGVILISKIDSP